MDEEEEEEEEAVFEMQSRRLRIFQLVWDLQTAVITARYAGTEKITWLISLRQLLYGHVTQSEGMSTLDFPHIYPSRVCSSVDMLSRNCEATGDISCRGIIVLLPKPQQGGIGNRDEYAF